MVDRDSNWDIVNINGNDNLQREFTFDDYASALNFVNQVGDLAEKANHHPDVHLSWGKVRVWMMTHSEGVITDKDHTLAKQIDQIALSEDQA